MAVYDEKTESEAEQLRRITGISPEEEQAMDRGASDGAAPHNIATGGGFYRAEKAKSVAPNELAKAESDAGGTFGASGGNNKTANPSVSARVRSFARSKVGKRSLIGGGVLGLGVGGTLIFMSIVSGPLQFVHIAQILDGAHFSHQEDAGNLRLGKMYRWLKQGNTVGETRISWLESKYKDHMLSQLKDIGLEPNFDSRTGYYKGFSIDTKNPKSPYYEMNNDEVKVALNEKYGVTSHQIADGKFYVPERSFFAQRRSFGGMTQELGYNKITTAEGTRVLSKFGGVDFHPMHILDKKVNESLIKLYDNWKTSKEERLKNGAKGATMDTTGAAEKDQNGKTTPLDGTDESPTADRVKSIMDSVKASKGVKITGGLAAAIGLVCIIRTVNDQIGLIRYAQVIQPLMRVGMDAIAVGYQIQSGQDVDPQEVEFLAKNLNTLDSKGNVVDTWDEAQGIQHITGGSGGIPMNQGEKDLINNVKPSWISWTDKSAPAGPAIGAVCSTAGQIVTGGVSVVIGVFSGGLASTIIGGLVSAIAAPKAIDFLSNLVAGDAANVMATGAAWGNNIDYGALFGANASSAHLGGVPLTTQQVSELNTEHDTVEQANYAQESMFARAFDPTDYRSLTGHLIDSQNGNTPARTVANIFGSLANFPKVVASTVGTSIFHVKAHAASNFQYAVPEFGFSAEELANSAVDNPYDNAESVAKILDQNGTNGVPDYIGRADKCFGDAITKDPTEGWSVIPSHDVQNLYDGTYPTDECLGHSDPTWLKVRMFIFDSRVMDGYACFQGEQESCDNDGFGSAISDGTTTTTGGGSLPTGSPQELATQLLPYLKSGKISCNGGQGPSCPDIAKTAAGQSIKGGTCYVSALDPQLLGLMLALAQKGHSFVFSAICSDHPVSTPGVIPHNLGKAADFNIIDGVFMGPQDVPWTSDKIAAAEKLDDDAAAVAPKTAAFGQVQCHPAFPELQSFTQFNDACHHQHIQVTQ